MARKLKVFGGLTRENGKYVRTIVATTTQKRASELVELSINELRTYWSITGNETELAVALAKPETVFKTKTENVGDKDFKEVTK